MRILFLSHAAFIQVLRALTRIVGLALLFAVLIVGNGGRVLAATCPSGMSQLDCNAIYGNWVNWVPDDGSTACDSSVGFGGTLDQFLQAIAYHESGGNPTANSGNGAYGKYQYIPRTWQSNATTYYPPATQYATANFAPENVQDAVAYLQYIPIYNHFNGDLFAMAVEHYLPSYAEIAHQNQNDPRLNYAPPGNNGLTVKQYGTDIINLITNGKASSVKLSYTSAPDFQTWLSKVGGAPAGISSTATSTNIASCVSGTCTTGTIRDRVVQCANDELALWTNGQLRPGNDYQKYTENRSENWCADFVSWVYKQAGDPFGPQGSYGGDWDISYTANFLVPPQDSTKFVVHDANGYTPQPGDIALHSQPGNLWYHTNLVASVNGSTITLVGGNQSANGGGFTDSKVSSYKIYTSTGDNIVDYISPLGN